MRRVYLEGMQSLLDGVKNKLVLPPGGDIDLTVLGVKAETRRAAPKQPQSSFRPMETSGSSK
jgi:hypothetical protein